MKFLLDTNVLSDILRRNEPVLAQLIQHHPADIAMSCVSEGELLYGVSNNPEATSLHKAVAELIKSITPLPWDSAESGYYWPQAAGRIVLWLRAGQMWWSVALWSGRRHRHRHRRPRVSSPT